jgi:hypothetical protein
MAADLDGPGIDPVKARRFIKREQFGARFAIQADVEAALAAGFLFRPGKHRAGKSLRFEFPGDREAVDIKRLAQRSLRPKQPVFLMQIHARRGLSLDSAHDQFTRVRDADKLVVRCFLRSPERQAGLDQPIRRFVDEAIRFGNIIHAATRDNERHDVRVSASSA